MKRVRILVSGLIVGCFSLGAVGCLDVDEDMDGSEEVYLDTADELDLPQQQLRAQLPPLDDGNTPDRPEDAALPGDGFQHPDDSTLPGASLLEAGDGLTDPQEPLQAELPEFDEDDPERDYHAPEARDY